MKDQNPTTEERTDLYLVNVPIGILFSPSLALGILKPIAQRGGLQTKVLYANMLLASVVGIDLYKDLNNIANSTNQVVEMLFQPYAGYEEYASLDEIGEFMKRSDPNLYAQFPYIRGVVERVWEKMDEYLDLAVETILRGNPRAVGCSYGFQQANSCFALLKRIKEQRPDIITFIGGSSCSEYSGQAIVDHKPFVDYVFCGETDDIFADAVKRMIQHDVEGLKTCYPSVLIKGGVPATHTMQDLNDIPFADYDEYFEQLEEYGLSDCIEVSVPFESSRGCWWGCKHRCRFCGLHFDPNHIQYRKKTLPRIVSELDYLKEKYGDHMFFFCDCVLDYNYTKEFPVYFKDKGYRLYAEVKTNMTREEIKGLSDAGFKWVQPGIEAIQDDLLKHMNKGNTAIRQLEYLKWSTAYGIYSFWNMITDFPMEEDAWYDETIERMRYITHLVPSNRNTLLYQRSSYYTMHAKDYGIHLFTAQYYRYYFGKDSAFTEAFAEYYSCAPHKRAYLPRLDEMTRQWQKEFFAHCVLNYFVDGPFMGILDKRECTAQERIVLDGVKKEICEKSESTIRIDRLISQLPDYDREEIMEAIEELYLNEKLIMKIGEEILFLAIPKELEQSYSMEEYPGKFVTEGETNG